MRTKIVPLLKPSSILEFSASWYVVFTPLDVTKPKHWWNYFINNEYAHVRAFTDMGEYWLTVDPLYSHTHIALVNKKVDLLGKALSDSRVVLVENLIKENAIPKILPFSCVSVVKSLLGIHDYSITPFQLYKNLLRRHNGRILWRWRRRRS